MDSSYLGILFDLILFHLIYLSDWVLFLVMGIMEFIFMCGLLILFKTFLKIRNIFEDFYKDQLNNHSYNDYLA